MPVEDAEAAVDPSSEGGQGAMSRASRKTGDDGSQRTAGEADVAGSTDTPEAAVTDPSDAFQVLGNEIRMGILETMLERVDGDGSSQATFSELFDASSVDTSAGFAYHLEQLVGPYLRKVEGEAGPRYELTYAGLTITRAIAAGSFTRRVDHPSIALDDPCPFCGVSGLSAAATDNVVTVSCRDCDRTLLNLGFPPSGFTAHGDRLPEAFDRHHRYRLGLLREGVCPECSGDVTGRLVAPTPETRAALPEELADHVQAAFECRQCGHDVRCPVSLTLLQHPAVVAFYQDHDRDARERPIWNVGHEWAESVISEDPLVVRVVVELDGDVLACFVSEDVRVREVQRTDDDHAADDRSHDDRSADERIPDDHPSTDGTANERPGPRARGKDHGESATSVD